MLKKYQTQNLSTYICGHLNSYQSFLNMSNSTTHPTALPPEERKNFILKSFTDNYANLISSDPGAWRGKFRKMSETPFAFYRGSAALFYADISHDQDPFINEKTGRVWIQGDLHAENFGTYMNGKGVLIFDVNDFDEAYVAPFNWDVKRFCASLALIGYQKALSDAEIRQIVAHGARVTPAKSRVLQTVKTKILPSHSTTPKALCFRCCTTHARSPA